MKVRENGRVINVPGPPREIGSRAADLPQPLLARLGAPYDYFRGIYRAPAEKTIRLILRTVDVGAVDVCFGSWLFAPAAWKENDEHALAIDGKVLRGAWSGEDTQAKLLSAMIQGAGLVVGQIRVPTTPTRSRRSGTCSRNSRGFPAARP
jgi:hypothetical protein